MEETVASYEAMAASYARRWFDRRLVEALARFTALLPSGARVLDVGCGPGRDVAWLAEQGFCAVGLDMARGMLIQARGRGVVAPLVQADMRSLPFADGSFQGVWVCASLLHIPRLQVAGVLRELRRVLRGYIYLSVKIGSGSEWVEDDAGHRRLFVYYRPANLRRLVEQCGFVVLLCRESPDLAGRSRPWIELLGCA